VQKKSARFFKTMVSKAEGSHQKKQAVDKAGLSPLIPRYKACLQSLSRVIQAENQGVIKPNKPIPDAFLNDLNLDDLTKQSEGHEAEEDSEADADDVLDAF